jgi:hypothetical protein
MLCTGAAVALNGSNTVLSDDIVGGQAKTADLGATAINSVKIGAGEVTVSDLGANAVNTAKIANGQGAGADVGANSVGPSPGHPPVGGRPGGDRGPN